MYFYLFLTASIMTALLFPSTARAIIILPPIIMLATVKLVALIVGVFSLPTTVLSSFIAAQKHPKTKRDFVIRTILYTVLALALIALVSFITIKLTGFQP